MKNLFYLPYLFLLCIFYALPCAGELADETIYLTWQKDPTTTMTIQWISQSQNKNNTLLFREKNESMWISATGYDLSFPHDKKLLLHRIELTDLKPYTDYAFKIDEKEYFFRTMPATLSDNLVRFVEGGDMYQGEDKEAVIKTNHQAAKTNPDFALIGGDIAYAVGKLPFQSIQRWVDWIKIWHQTMITPDKRMIPVVVAIGNHDLVGQFGKSPAQARVFSLLFPMPGPQIYNTLDFGKYLSLIILDSGHATAIEGKQSKWLKSILIERRDVTYRFAVYHVPAYPSVRSFTNSKSKKVRRYWVPIFDSEYLELAFEHNDHAYKRTFPLRNNKIDSAGIIYVGDGAWGVKPRSPKSKKKLFYLAKFAKTRYFNLMTLRKDSFQLLSIDPMGLIIDEVTRNRI